MNFNKVKRQELRRIDEVFSNGKEPEGDVREIPLRQLRVFEKHPFSVREDREMSALIASDAENGVLMPIIVRPNQDGYEILSGHRRTFAARSLGMETIPAIVKEIDDDEAVILMVDSNLQREFILPSEKAKAYKMRMEAMKRQAGRRPKDAQTPAVGKESREILAEEIGESAIQIQRYIRLNSLIDELLQEVHLGRIPLNAGVSLSHLDPNEQKKVFDGYLRGEFPLTLNIANTIKEMAKAGALDSFLEDYRKKKEKKELPVKKPVAVRLDADLYQKYFSSMKPKEALEIIEKALQAYFQQ